VKQNKGSIQVQSEPGKGTKLSILLPGHAHGANGTAQRVAVPVDAEHGGHETILLVEDEPSVLSLGKTLLERLGYRVLPANTPDGALQLARDHSGEIHLLMTDVVMPDMNGRDLAKKLLSQYPDMKRLFVSGYTANVIASHGILEDGVNFIQKPFNRHVLAVKLREILDAE
jgi:DNA-binding NtrC family response regulator